ncbi:MAG: hypothetical protein HY395_01680, partial [Candidatus Doudnabacteria bacterium]|nr:hypothetical protein [Candidatus Doudnabacteria bacterium]
LEKYLKLELSKEYLLKSLGGKKYHNSSSLVSVTIEDLKNIINAGLQNKITKSDFSDWIDFVWFSGYYNYEDKDQEMIAQIMNDLEDTEQLSDSGYLDLLSRVNTDISQNKYPKKEALPVR